MQCDPQLVPALFRAPLAELGARVRNPTTRPATICACGADHVNVVAAVTISIAVAVDATVAFPLRRTVFAAWFCENCSRLRHRYKLFTPVDPTLCTSDK